MDRYLFLLCVLGDVLSWTVVVTFDSDSFIQESYLTNSNSVKNFPFPINHHKP